jgi:hypothetical protein
MTMDANAEQHDHYLIEWKNNAHYDDLYRDP